LSLLNVGPRIHQRLHARQIARIHRRVQRRELQRHGIALAVELRYQQLAK